MCDAIILRTAGVVVRNEIRELLLTPLESTGLPPHMCIMADKITVNRRTNQVMMVAIMHKGTRIALPTGAPLCTCLE